MKKSVAKKAPIYRVSHCNFTAEPWKPSAEYVAASVAIAEACRENAIALRAAANLIEGAPDHRIALHLGPKP